MSQVNNDETSLMLQNQNLHLNTVLLSFPPFIFNLKPLISLQNFFFSVFYIHKVHNNILCKLIISIA